VKNLKIKREKQREFWGRGCNEQCTIVEWGLEMMFYIRFYWSKQMRFKKFEAGWWWCCRSGSSEDIPVSGCTGLLVSLRA
jgi:hypothetical protein